MLTKKHAEYYEKLTGKPGMEIYLQQMFILTEIEGKSYEEAKKIMDENWEK